MADQAHEWTDGEIERLERSFRIQYEQAAREMQKRLDDMMESYEKANEEWKRRVGSGDATQDDYDKWLKGQASDRAFVQSMAQTLANDATRANQLAMDAVDDAIPAVFAENANYAAYQVESGIGYETHAFDLYDQSTVRRLISKQSELLPPLPKPRIDNGRDLRWNRQRFAGAILQSVLQGESVPRAAERIGRVMRMNEAAATRAARTALTGAENAGRVDSYRRAQEIGIELEQEWLATHDGRTRITHRLLDGEHVPIGERFVPEGYGDKYSIGFPGDPTALGEMVYNCRCTLVAWLPSIAEEDNRSWEKLPDGITYDEWKHGKKAEQEREEADGVVDGKDITGTWKRRENEFGFAIEDVINAQGFDGKPRVLEAEDFDAAVNAANGGNGFIAQRVYSAPNQETLDSYRQSLYEGKWYVDCSHGGAGYGQGMYCSGSFAKKLDGSVAHDMEHYAQMSLSGFSKRTTFHDLDKGEQESVINEVVERLFGKESSQVRHDMTLFLKDSAGGFDLDYDELYPAIDRLRPTMYKSGRMQEARQALRDWERVNDPGSYIETLTMDPSTRVLWGKDIRSEMERARKQLIDAGWDELEIPKDNGVLASMLGYDAIVAGYEEEPSVYVVVLNRTKLIIKEPE